MIGSIGGAATQVQQLASTRQVQTPAGTGALPEAASPFEIAQQIQEVQVENVKRTLDAQTLVLDLLV